jgi:hypothetical protein
MLLETIILIFSIISLIIVLTMLILYSSFGPKSKILLDPFEEDDD